MCFPRKVPRPGDGWFHPSAKRVARLGGAAEGCAPSAALRAARGRGNKPIFAFLHWENPLRPAPGTVRNPARAGEFLQIPPHKHRAPCLRKLSFPDSRGYDSPIFTTYSRVPGTEFLSPSSVCPLPGRTPFSRPRERRDEESPRNSTRAPALKDNRLRLHNPSVSTSPLLLLPAFPQT